MLSSLPRLIVIVGLVAVAGINLFATRLGIAPAPAPVATTDAEGPRLIPVPPGRR